MARDSFRGEEYDCGPPVFSLSGKTDQQINPYSEVSAVGDFWSTWVMGPYRSKFRTSLEPVLRWRREDKPGQTSEGGAGIAATF